LVSRMQLTLASASEAEKSAVLAITDRDSQVFADQARIAASEVEKARRELGELLKIGGTEDEKALFNQFSELFPEFQSVDDELLKLAVKNTNIKAYSLAFGPAAAALNDMNVALSRLIASNADFPDERQVTDLCKFANHGSSW